MGRREDDPIDARRQRVEVEREAGPVRGRCEADFAVRRARVGEKDDVAIVADLLGSIETESRNVDTGAAKGNGDFTAAADAAIGRSDDRPLGKVCVLSCSSRCFLFNLKKISLS